GPGQVRERSARHDPGAGMGRRSAPRRGVSPAPGPHRVSRVLVSDPTRAEVPTAAVAGLFTDRLALRNLRRRGEGSAGAFVGGCDLEYFGLAERTSDDLHR